MVGLIKEVNSQPERHCSRMVRATRLWCKKRRRFEPGLRHPTTRKLCQHSSKWVSVSNQGKIRQRKERDGLRLSFAVPTMHAALTSMRARLLGYHFFLTKTYSQEKYWAFRQL